MKTDDLEKDYLQLIDLGSSVMHEVNPLAWPNKNKAADWIVDTVSEMLTKFGTDREVFSISTGCFELSMTADKKEDGSYFFVFDLNQNIVSFYNDNDYKVGDYAGFVWTGTKA